VRFIIVNNTDRCARQITVIHHRRTILVSITRIVGTIVALFVVMLPISALAQSIEIKGLRVGMTKAEVQKKFPTWKNFTIAGVPNKYESLTFNIEYQDDRLNQFTFFFDAASFETVLEAIREKYPATKCKTSKVGNAMGAKFEQVQCLMSDSESVLELLRYVGDIQTSMLSLISKKALDDQARKTKQQKKDI
jgi:hypothetical protein